MALPGSGPINFTLVKSEIGLSGTINLNATTVRNLAGKPSGTIAMSNLYGKSNFTPAGTILSYFCSGTTRYVTKANGSGGTYDEVYETNSTACGYSPYPPYGTFIGNGCVGYSYVAYYADGNGGYAYYTTLENNSSQCGYVPPPPPPAAGTPSSGEYCQGTNMVQNYHNGSGGYYTLITQQNSVACGYVAPPQSMIVTGYNGLSEGTSTGTTQFAGYTYPYVEVTGGSGSYTYQWSITSQTSGGSMSMLSPTNGYGVNVIHTITKFGYSGMGTVQCVVTDTGTGQTQTIPLTVEWRWG